MCSFETGSATIQIAYSPVSMPVWLLPAAWAKKMVHILHARSTTMKPTSCATVVSHSPKKGAKHGQFTLLDNESILHSVRRYLAAQNLGTITPQELCCHINQVMIPALDLLEKKSSICECTAINWLKKLGYKCTDVKKGVYHDGHKCPNVIEACKKFLDQMQQYEQ